MAMAVRQELGAIYVAIWLFMFLFLVEAVLGTSRGGSFLRMKSDDAEQTQIDRCNFPNSFVFGVSSSAYQYEGAITEGGRQPCIWDSFTENSINIQDGSNAKVTVDQYHHIQGDVTLINNMGMDAYRFSISWARIYPDGKVNTEGVTYYNTLIDTLLQNGIQPYVTLYHWDLPQAIETSSGGWLNVEIINQFSSYAKACFEEFGDRIKYWITFNEPHMFLSRGYSTGIYAPGRCTNCSKGDSSTEPYIAAHNVLLSHAAAVKVYREQFQAKQRGHIGITLDARWYEPYSNSSMDVAAARSLQDFEFGWFFNPIVFGEYPEVMSEYLGHRLPIFSKEESQRLINSIDFLGLNHYTTNYVRYAPSSTKGYEFDPQAVRTGIGQDGTVIGPLGPSKWLYVVPWGFRKLLNYIKDTYNNPVVIVTENGADGLVRDLHDERRVHFHNAYLNNLIQALNDGVDVRGYFAWSLLDDWEWTSGYTINFGLHYVDLKTLQRYPKFSAHWFNKFLNINCSV